MSWYAVPGLPATIVCLLELAHSWYAHDMTSDCMLRSQLESILKCAVHMQAWAAVACCKRHTCIAESQLSPLP